MEGNENQYHFCLLRIRRGFEFAIAACGTTQKCDSNQEFWQKLLLEFTSFNVHEILKNPIKFKWDEIQER